MRTTSCLFIALILLALPALAPPAHASFEDSPTGGRATGVDGAMTSVADDVFALYYNPAGAAFLPQAEVGTYVGRLYGGLSDNSNLSRDFLGYVQPFNHQAIGFSYTALTLSDLYKEETFGLSYARRFGDYFSLGVTGKRYHKVVGHDFNTDNAELQGTTQIGVSDPVFSNGHQSEAWGGDVAALYRLGGGWKTGLMVRNVNEPDMALGSTDSDPVSRSWNAGISRQWNGHAVMLDATRERFTQMETRLHGGYESWIFGGHVGLRAGGGYGERDYRRVTAGFSYRLSLLQLDYGFIMPLETVEGTQGTHQVSLVLRFGMHPENPVLALISRNGEIQSDLSDLLAEPLSEHSRGAVAMVQQEAGQITVSPSYVSLKPKVSQQFKAQVTGIPDGRIVWSLMPPLGTLSQNGVYQAPPGILFAQNVWVTAKSEAYHMHYERAVVHLEPYSTGPVSVDIPTDVSPNDYSKLDRVAQIMRQYPHVNATIEVDMDDQGPAPSHQRLTEQRAAAVRALLIYRFGIAPKRLIAQGFGSSRPVASNQTEAGRKMNRRITAVLRAPEEPAETISDSEVSP